MKLAPAVVLNHLTSHFLGAWIGSFTVLGVVVLAVTSGDTALRSLRLSLAEMLHCDQTALSRRLLVSLPLIGVVALLLWWSNQDAKSFNYLWNYFAWGNQVLAVFTLFTVSVWQMRRKRNFLITLIPAAFMMFVVVSFILWTSPVHKLPWGFGLDLNLAYSLAGDFTAFTTGLVLYQGIVKRKEDEVAGIRD
jgi:carbon starvation protein CstA